MAVNFGTHRGVVVTVTNVGLFQVSERADTPAACEGLETPSWDEMIRKINERLAVKFKRVQVWFENRYLEEGDGFRKVTITSITSTGEMWVKDSSGSREKLYASTVVYLDTPENREMIAGIREHRKQIKQWESRIEALEGSMTKWRPEVD
jgi:ribosomal protein L30/L7E